MLTGDRKVIRWRGEHGGPSMHRNTARPRRPRDFDLEIQGRNLVVRKANPSQERLPARIRTQWLKQWPGPHLEHPAVALLQGPVQPLECLVRLAQPGIAGGDGAGEIRMFLANGFEQSL